MNLDKMLFDFHTEVTSLESDGRGGEAAWCAQRVAVQGLMTLGLTLSSQMGEHEKAAEIFAFNSAAEALFTPGLPTQGSQSHFEQILLLQATQFQPGLAGGRILQLQLRQ